MTRSDNRLKPFDYTSFISSGQTWASRKLNHKGPCPANPLQPREGLIPLADTGIWKASPERGFFSNLKVYKRQRISPITSEGNDRGKYH